MYNTARLDNTQIEKYVTINFHISSDIVESTCYKENLKRVKKNEKQCGYRML